MAQIRFFNSENQHIDWDFKIQDSFDVFDLPVSYSISRDELESQYLVLSKATHPDHIQEVEAEAKTKILQCSSQVNKAYRELKDPQSRAEVLLTRLSHENQVQLNGKDLPPGFLMEMLELQEELEDLEAKGLTEEVEDRLEEIEQLCESELERILSKVADCFASYDKAQDKEQLHEIRRQLNCLKYYQRISEIAERLIENGS